MLLRLTTKVDPTVNTRLVAVCICHGYVEGLIYSIYTTVVHLSINLTYIDSTNVTATVLYYSEALRIYGLYTSLSPMGVA